MINRLALAFLFSLFAATAHAQIVGGGSTGTGAVVRANSPVLVDDVDIAAAGVRLLGADGTLTLLGLGNGNDENLILDFDNAAANAVNLTSGTSVNTLNFGTINAAFSTATGLAFAGGGPNPILVKGGAGPETDDTSIEFSNTTDDYLVIEFKEYTDFWLDGEASFNWGSGAFMYFNGTSPAVDIVGAGLNVGGTFAPLTNESMGIRSGITSAANASELLFGIVSDMIVDEDIQEANTVYAQMIIQDGDSLAGAGYLYYGQANLQGAGSVAGNYFGVWNEINLASTFTISGDVYGYFFDITKAGGATISNQIYGVWIEDLAGLTSESSYPFWYDGGGGDCALSGVTRINHFGIYAYYNPCFAQYTPDLANFERLVLQWGDTGVRGTDNIAYIGVEAGGTGTNRALELIGGGLRFNSTLVTPASTGTRYLCISTAGVVTSSAAACSGT